jgi:hypothetical protein
MADHSPAPLSNWRLAVGPDVRIVCQVCGCPPQRHFFYYDRQTIVCADCGQAHEAVAIVVRD